MTIITIIHIFFIFKIRNSVYVMLLLLFFLIILIKSKFMKIVIKFIYGFSSIFKCLIFFDIRIFFTFFISIRNFCSNIF